VSHNGGVRTGQDEPADPAPRRAAGRPRSEQASQAILDAVLELIAEQGSIVTLSMEAVAARSGASKATIYRRWASKEEMVAAAVDSIKSPVQLELPHTSARDDLLRLGRSIRTSLSEKEQRILRVITFEGAANPELRAHQQRYMARRREAGRDVFRYWVERGELRDDIDIGIAAAMFTNTILMIMVYDHFPDLKSPDVVERVLDHLLPGIATDDS
jgi:AcrR family transcriptional regulator